MFKTIGLIVLGIVILLSLPWMFIGNDYFLYKFFAPKQEQVRREVFEETKSYNQGMVQTLQNMQFEYIKSTKDQQESLRGIILHRVADYDVNKLPNDLKQFISELKRSY